MFSGGAHYHHVVTSNVDAGYGVHVCNHARFVSDDVVYFISSMSIRASTYVHLLDLRFLLKLCVHDLEII